MILPAPTWLLDFWDRVRQRRVVVELRVHRGWFPSAPERGECYFLNIKNSSPEREVTVTHVWVASHPPVHAPVESPSPRIKPGGQWETWVSAGDVPAGTENVEWLGRARLGDDTELRSVPRHDVPPAGYIPR